MEVKQKTNSQRWSSEQNHKSLISVNLLLNKFKIDQVCSISYPGKNCSIELKRFMVI